MQKYLKGIVLGLAIAGVSSLTACTHTMQGAGQDIQAAANAVDPAPAKKTVHHKRMSHKKTTTKMMNNGTATTTTTTTDTTATTPSTTTTTN